MRDTGLSEAQIALLQRIFAAYPDVEQVRLYGSRAKGSYHERSDIDLVAYGNNLRREHIAAILLDLEDSDIPYLIDLQSYQDLHNPQLIDHINRVGLPVYRRDRQDSLPV